MYNPSGFYVPITPNIGLMVGNGYNDVSRAEGISGAECFYHIAIGAQ
jgi:hypothetical protein